MKQIGTVKDLNKGIESEVFVQTRLGFIKVAFTKQGHTLVYDYENNPHVLPEDAPIFSMDDPLQK